jgi:hypothetical protein
MKNAVFANIVDTRQQLWQCIQDAGNEIRTTPQMFESVRASFQHSADVIPDESRMAVFNKGI